MEGKPDYRNIEEEKFVKSPKILLKMIPAPALLPDFGGSVDIDPDDDLFDFLNKSDLTMPTSDDLMNSSSSFTLDHSELTSTLDMKVNPPAVEVRSEPSSEILSDCMWSSALNFFESIKNQPGRNRDDSLTLSECADSLFKDIKDIDSILHINQDIRIKEGDHDINNETTEDDDDLEIDVVSDTESMTSTATSATSYSSSSLSSSSSTKSLLKCNQPKSLLRKKPGESLLTKNCHQRRNPRSLLRCNKVNHTKTTSNGKVVPQSGHHEAPSPQTLIDHMNGDHCYFSVRPEDREKVTSGLLTPNESCSETDEEENVVQHKERKVVKKEQHPIKFKFRMKFKANEDQEGIDQGQEERSGTKRKSAMKNPHCPSPVKKVKVTESEPVKGSVATVVKRSMSVPSLKSSARVTPRSSPVKSHGNAQQKTRDLRDLHNSMERQRRVDLKNNFDHVKDLVPELRDIEKASKLTILDKSAEYCKFLTSNESVLITQKDQEIQRNNLFKKKLAQLMESFNATSNKTVIKTKFANGYRTTNSGRISVVSSRHSGRVV